MGIHAGEGPWGGAGLRCGRRPSRAAAEEVRAAWCQGQKVTVTIRRRRLG
jgi:hypothetical protein